MIGTLRGSVTHLGADYVVVEISGVGYRVVVAPKLTARLRPEREAHFFIHHLVRDDQQTLFGFGSAEELAFFELLMTVTGVGPRLALAIVGAHPVTRLQLAIVGDDLDLLTSVSGVGKRTAQRIVLELKEKIHAASIAVGPGAASDSDVVAALESLGYTNTEARRAAGAVAGTDDALDARIKAALQALARSR
jgi:Holliday junction DNA helicase RuvA